MIDGLKAHLRYLSYVLRHKWWVFVAGLRVGAPLWRLIIHDWSKFSPAEWQPYVLKFYGGTLREGGKKRQAKIVDDAIEQRFSAAWLHHVQRNPHHWNHWLLYQHGKDIRPMPMPDQLLREMVADWAGAGRAISGKWELPTWYATNRDKILLDPTGRVIVENIIACHFGEIELAATR